MKRLHGKVVAVGLGSRRRCGDHGVEDGEALRDFGIYCECLVAESPPLKFIVVYV
jgi:hypothetical protein